MSLVLDFILITIKVSTHSSYKILSQLNVKCANFAWASSLSYTMYIANICTVCYTTNINNNSTLWSFSERRRERDFEKCVGISYLVLCTIFCTLYSRRLPPKIPNSATTWLFGLLILMDRTGGHVRRRILQKNCQKRKNYNFLSSIRVRFESRCEECQLLHCIGTINPWSSRITVLC